MFRPILISTLVLLLIAPFGAHARELSPLVSTDWLAENLGGDDLVILDIRSSIDGSDRGTFEESHIPGAVYSNYTHAAWRKKEGDVPGKLPPVEDLERLIGSLGIDNDSGRRSGRRRPTSAARPACTGRSRSSATTMSPS